MTLHFFLPWRPPQIAVDRPVVTVTPRQADALTGLCLGLTNFQIGRRLGVAEETAKTHVVRLLRVLGARDRCHAVALATSGQVTVNVKEVWR